MKITKQKLKEIVREELSALTESEFFVKRPNAQNDEMYLGDNNKFTDYDNRKKFLNQKDAIKSAKKHNAKQTTYVVNAKDKRVSFSEDVNEDHSGKGDASYLRRKLKLACEDSENILQMLANMTDDTELPNWLMDKVSKSADYLNIARDYLASDMTDTLDVNPAGEIHESEKEFPIWGMPPGAKREELLYTKAKSHAEAKKIVKILTDKHGVTKARIQVLDLAQNPADLWKSKKLLNVK